MKLKKVIIKYEYVNHHNGDVCVEETEEVGTKTSKGIEILCYSDDGSMSIIFKTVAQHYVTYKIISCQIVDDDMFVSKKISSFFNYYNDKIKEMDKAKKDFVKFLKKKDIVNEDEK